MLLLFSGVDAGNVGGLIGDGKRTEIRYSYAIGVNISTTGINDNLGGLTGDMGTNTVIHASYAAGFIFPIIVLPVVWLALGGILILIILMRLSRFPLPPPDLF